tara:strand:- start:344 stop:721 length:378 start_codon:yes stop_codon:yes gene_type:complete
MNKTRTYFASLTLAAMMALSGGNAYAASFDIDLVTGIGRLVEKTGSRSDQDQARQAVREGRILPLSQVLPIVQQRVPGRLLDANLVERGGRSIYLIKMMTNNGNVAIVSADATNGNILNVRQGGH